MAIDRLTAPLYRPIRRLLPDFGGIDFSPLVVLILIQVDQEAASRRRDAILRRRMTARLIDGKAYAAGLRQRVAEVAVSVSRPSRAARPGLAVVLVGEHPPSAAYVRSKAKATVEAGMESFEHKLPADCSQGAADGARR